MQSILDQGNAPVDQIDIATLKEEAQQLFKAVTLNDLARVRQLLPCAPSAASSSSALSVNFADSAGFTFLMIAARLGHAEMVDYLLSFGDIDVNARSENGNTALLYACYKPSARIVQALLDGGANFFATNSNADSVAMCAAVGGHQPVWDLIVRAYHAIRTAKLPTSQQKPWEQGKATPVAKRFFTVRNEEGLTALMCAVMSDNMDIVRSVVSEARKELGIHTPDTPSASAMFFPSIWPGPLGPSNFQSIPGGLVDPSPEKLLQWVDAQNLMGDTALHIAAQNNNLAMYELLVDLTGADPIKANRRGKLTFQLFEEASAAKAEDGDLAVVTTPACQPVSMSDRASDFVTRILDLQRKLRAAYLESSALDAEKRFAELMAEEENQGAKHQQKGGKKGKATTATRVEGEKKPKKKAKKAAATTTASSGVPEKSDADPDSDVASDAESAAAADEAPATAAKPAASAASAISAVGPVAAAPTPLSVAAPAFVPLAELAALDAANGWETVQKPTKKQAAATATAAAMAAATPTPAHTQAAKSKKKVTTEEPHAPAKRKSTHASKAAGAAAADKAPLSQANRSTKKLAHAAAATPSATVAPADATAPFVLSSTVAAVPRRAWRPMTAPQQKKQTREVEHALADGAAKEAAPPAPSVPVAAVAAALSPVAPSFPSPDRSSGASALSDLHGLLSGLHPHMESTDIQVSHFLGDGWSSLSLSQLSTLEEVYTALGRQIRDHQLALFQQQHHELHSELMRTKGELHRLAKEVSDISKSGAAKRETLAQL